MQLTNNYKYALDQDAPAEAKGIEMPVGETITLASLGKYLIGLVLAPWLWFERKRVDRLQEKLDDFYTKEEVKEKIEDKLAPIQKDVEWIRRTMEREYGNQ